MLLMGLKKGLSQPFFYVLAAPSTLRLMLIRNLYTFFKHSHSLVAIDPKYFSFDPRTPL
jgi:hypothetical protein